MPIKDEIDFKEFLKHPIKLFGLSYIYFLAVGLAIGAYYVMNLNTISRNETPPFVIADSVQFIQDIPMQRGALIAPVNVNDVAVPTKALIDKGALLYKTNCASCHGDNGMGDGISAGAMKVKPRNYHSSEGWKNGRKISQIYRTLQNGILESGMPAFNYTPAADRFAIIHYIRTFADDFPKDSLSDLADLEKTYSLSKGTQLPAQIPVKLAMQMISKESQEKVEMVNSFRATMMGTTTEDIGAKIAMDVSRDRNRIVTAALAVKGRSLDEFIKTVSSDPFTIGFKIDVLRLKSDEWNALYVYLSKVNRQGNG